MMHHKNKKFFTVLNPSWVGKATVLFVKRVPFFFFTLLCFTFTFSCGGWCTDLHEWRLPCLSLRGQSVRISVSQESETGPCSHPIKTTERRPGVLCPQVQP